MNIHTIYGEELTKLLSVKEVLKFLEEKEKHASFRYTSLKKYTFKNGLRGLKIEFFDKDDLFAILEPTVAFEIDTKLITYMFNAEIITTSWTQS